MSNLSTIFSALKTYLTGVSQVSDLVSSRIYAVEVPTDTVTPFIVMDRLSKTSMTILSGGRAGLAEGTFIFSCTGANHSDVAALQEALELALGGLVGTYGGVNFQGCELVAGVDSQISWLDDRGHWEGSLTFDLMWTEASAYV